MRGDVWMHVSGAIHEQQRLPSLYKSLLTSEHDVDIGNQDGMPISGIRGVV